MEFPEFKESRRGKFILAADDQESVRRLMGLVFDRAGFNVEFFEDGADLIEYLRINRGKVTPDAIVLDIEMPKLNGYDTCRAIKQDYPEITAPILFFTSVDSVDSHKLALQVGADEYIIKPFQPDKLVEVLDDWSARTTAWDSSQVTHDTSRQDRLVMTAYENEAASKMISLALEKAGFSVDAYENGAGLLIALEQAHPSVILLDVNMPEMNGFETCDRIRKEFIDLTAPILLSTNSKTDDSLTRCEIVGGNGFFPKSLSPEKLVDRVEKWSKIQIEI